MNLEFATSSRVIFGRGEFKRAGELAESLGKRALIVTGKASQHASGNLDRLTQQLRAREIPSLALTVDREPTVGLIDSLVNEARAFNPEVIVAIGGGSVLDAGKAVGALLTNPGSVLDYLEEVGAGKAIAHPPVPMIAVPTTAGTGAEVTKNAVIRDDAKKFKRSMRSPLLRPEIALVDPMLTVTAPASVTAASGLDALTQLIEGFTSRRSGILTDGLAREGLTLISSSLEQAYFNPEDPDARESTAMASLLGGMTLDNAGLGAVHGLASPMGAMFDAPHGVICANLLPEITRLNIDALEDDGANSKTLAKYQEISRILTGDKQGQTGRLITMLKLLRRTLQVPRLPSYGMRAEHIPAIVAGCRGGSMQTNPVYLSDAVLTEMLKEALKDKAPVEEQANA